MRQETTTERQVRQMAKWLIASTALWLGMAVLVSWNLYRSSTVSTIVRTHEVDVIDRAGRVRLRLSADFPKPTVMGAKNQRLAPVAGAMLYDQHGNERGGLLTDDTDHAFLSLDSRTKQEVTLVAYPDGGSALTLTFDGSRQKVAIESSSTGPTLELVKDGTRVFEQPSRMQK